MSQHVRGHQHPGPTPHNRQRPDADQPADPHVVNTQKPRDLGDRKQYRRTGSSSGLHRLFLYSMSRLAVWEPSPSSKATMQRDNYVDARITKFNADISAGQASEGMRRNSQEEYRAGRYSSPEC